MHQEEEGFTLIELMLALAIFCIVLALGYLFHAYVNKSFTISSEQSEVQFNVRMAKELIAEEVRFASCVKVLKADGINFADLSCGGEPIEAIFVKDGSLKYYKDETVNNLLTNNPEHISFNVKFEKNAEVFLGYAVEGKMNGRQTFKMNNEIQILGIGQYEEIKDESNGNGNAIIYVPGI